MGWTQDKLPLCQRQTIHFSKSHMHVLDWWRKYLEKTQGEHVTTTLKGPEPSYCGAAVRTTLPFFPYKRNFFGFHEVRETGELTDSLSYKPASASTHIRIRWSSMSVKMAPRGKSTVFAGRIHGLGRYFHRFQDSLQLEGKLDKTWTTLRLQCFPDHDEDDEQKSFHIKIADSHEWYVKVTQKKLEET